ncbi:MAG: hypothetical protein KDB37_11165 [Ilumatobacter sp.]|nr:hypothetical protein [Ilumatobacter sp.]
MPEQPPCDVDPVEFNVHSAWWNRLEGRWFANRHGVVPGLGDQKSVAKLEACGCVACAAAASRLAAHLERHPYNPDDWEAAAEERSRIERRARQRTVQPPAVDPEPPARVDADEVRAHLEDLIAGGMTSGQIAAAAEVDYSTVRRCLQPWASRVSASTAHRLLTVSP